MFCFWVTVRYECSSALNVLRSGSESNKRRQEEAEVQLNGGLKPLLYFHVCESARVHHGMRDVKIIIGGCTHPDCTCRKYNTGLSH